MTSSVSAQDATIARVECTDAVMRFFGHYDRREYPQMYALMTPDGVWNRPDGAARVGPELEASMAKRSANLAVVHVVSNLFTDVTAADRANVRGVMTVYRDENGKLSPGAAKLSGPGSIIEFAMGFTKLGSTWRIHQIDINYLFKA